jgi:outer membrane protein, adhesin transport system
LFIAASIFLGLTNAQETAAPASASLTLISVAAAKPPATASSRAVVVDLNKLAGLSFSGLLDLNRKSPLVQLPSANSLLTTLDSSPKEFIGLDEALDLGRTRSYQLAAAQARLQSAERSVSAARGNMLPRATARSATGTEISAPGSRTDPDTGTSVLRSVHNRNDLTLSVTQPLIDAPAIAEIGRLKALKDVSLAAASGLKNTNTVDITTAYFNLIQNTLLLDLANAHIQRFQRLLAYISSRVEGGGTSSTEGERVRGRVLNATSLAEEARGNLDQAVITFNRLTGVVPAKVRIPDWLGAEIPNSLSAAIEIAMDNNTDIAAARANRESASFEKKAVIGRFVPRVSLEHSQSRIENANGAIGWANNQSTMFVISVPFLSGGADVQQTRAIGAKQEGFRFDLLEAERQMLETLTISYSSLRTGEARLAASRDELEANARVAESYDEQFRNSNRSLLDLMDAYQRLYSSQTDLVKISYATLMLQYQILRVMGRVDLNTASAGTPPQADGKAVPSNPQK